MDFYKKLLRVYLDYGTLNAIIYCKRKRGLSFKEGFKVTRLVVRDFRQEYPEIKERKFVRTIYGICEGMSMILFGGYILLRFLSNSNFLLIKQEAMMIDSQIVLIIWLIFMAGYLITSFLRVKE
ncbi:MAG: hypothetical protein N2645_18380 [Clostridia bacterium]|nr:hypothetical protein [Clostridia bacterium]